MFQRVLWSWRRRQQQQATSSRHSADQDNSPLVDNNHISTVITDIKLLNGANESRSKDHDRMEVSVAVFPSLMSPQHCEEISTLVDSSDLDSSMMNTYFSMLQGLDRSLQHVLLPLTEEMLLLQKVCLEITKKPDEEGHQSIIQEIEKLCKTTVDFLQSILQSKSNSEGFVSKLKAMILTESENEEMSKLMTTLQLQRQMAEKAKGSVVSVMDAPSPSPRNRGRPSPSVTSTVATNRFQQIQHKLQMTNKTWEIDRQYQKHFPGSKSWLLSEVMDWFEGSSESGAEDSRKVCWVQAKSGMGKTVFTAMLSKQLPTEQLLAVIYCHTLQHRNLLDVLNDMLYQIVMKYHMIHDLIWSQLEALNDGMTAENVLFYCLDVAVHNIRNAHPTVKSLLLVIDGLDELPISCRADILRFFSSNFLGILFPGIQVLVTSAVQEDILQALTPWTKHIIAEDDIRYHEDILYYFEKSTRQLLEEIYPSYEEDVLQEMVAILLEKSEGNFVYTTIVQEDLDDLVLSIPTQSSGEVFLTAFRTRLLELPQGLHSAYQQAVNRLHQLLPQYSQSILVYFLCARENLHVDVLAALLEITGDEALLQQVTSALQTLFPLHEDITNNIFIPCHSSLKAWLIHEGYDAQVRDTHADIVGKLLAYMGMRYNDMPITASLMEADIEVDDAWLQCISMQSNAFESLSTSTNHHSILMYALKHCLEHLNLYCTMKQSTVMAVLAYCLLTTLSWQQVCLKLLSTSTFISMLKEGIRQLETISSSSSSSWNVIKEKYCRDLQGILWTLEFCRHEVEHVKKFGWSREWCTQLTMRLQPYRFSSMRINALLQSAEMYLQQHGGWEYIGGTITNVDSRLKKIIPSYGIMQSLKVFGEHHMLGIATNAIIIFQLSDGALHAIFEEEESTCIIEIVIWTSDLQTLFSGAVGGDITIWNRNTRRPIAQLGERFHGVLEMFLAVEETRLLVLQSSNLVKIWDWKTCHCEHVIVLASPQRWLLKSIVLISDDHLAVYYNHKQCISMYDIRTAKHLQKFTWPVIETAGSLSFKLSRNAIHSTHRIEIVPLEKHEQRFLSFGGDEVRVWNVAHRWFPCERIFTIKDRIISAIQLTLNEDKLLTFHTVGKLVVWEMSTGVLLYDLDSHHHNVLAPLPVFSFAKGDALVMTASEYDCTIRVYDIARGNCEYVWSQPDLKSAIWSEDFQYVISWDRNASIRLWYLSTGCCTLTLNTKQDSIRHVIHSRICLNHLFTCGTDGSIRIWNIAPSIEKHGEASNDLLKSVELKGTSSPSFDMLCNGFVSIRHNSIMTYATDETVCFWNIADRTCVKQCEGHPSRQFYYNTTAANVKFRCHFERKIHLTTDIDPYLFQPVYRDFNYEVGSEDDTIDQEDEEGSREEDNEEHGDDDLPRSPDLPYQELGSYYTNLRMSPDQNKYISWSKDCQFLVWNMSTSSCEFKFSGHEKRIISIAFVSNASQFISWSEDTTIRLWNYETGKCEHVFSDHRGVVLGVKLSPSQQQMVSWSEDCDIRIWNLNQRHAVMICQEEKRRLIYGVAWTSDESKVISWCGIVYGIRIWCAKTGKCLLVLQGHSNCVRDVLVIAHNSKLVSWSEDCTIRVWNLLTGRCEQVLEGHGGIVHLVRSCANETKLASMSLDGSVRIWSLQGQGRCEHIFRGKFAKNYEMFLSNDEKKLVAGMVEKEIRVFNLDTGECEEVLDPSQCKYITQGRFVEPFFHGEDPYLTSIGRTETGMCVFLCNQDLLWMKYHEGQEGYDLPWTYSIGLPSAKVQS